MSSVYTIDDLQNELDAFGALGETGTKEEYIYHMKRLDAMHDLWHHLSSKDYGNLLINILWVCKQFVLTDKGLQLMNKYYPAYEKRYGFPNNDKVTIHEVWALLHIRNNDEYSAYEHLKKSAYNLFTDNVDYSGFEFFSFRDFTSYALEDIKNNTLSFSHPRQFNDPMDTLLFHWNTHCLSNETEEEQRSIRFLQQKVYDHLKVRCFVRTSRLPRNGNVTGLQELINKEQKIEDVNPIMWAHYANYHKGFCVKYCFPNNFLRSINSQDLVCTRVRDVKYWPTMDMAGKNKLSIEDALFVKSDYWKYENEVRVVHYDPNSHSDYKLLELPNDSIVAIYLGLKCSDSNREQMQLILRDKAIPLYQMIVAKNDFFRLEAKRIS